jgi:hypothetical protein
MKTLKQLWLESAVKVPISHAKYYSTWLDECLDWTVKAWLEQYKQPIEGCSMRNNVKALLVLQGKQQMITELLEAV